MHLGIIAGGGKLPQLLADHCTQAGISFHCFVVEGQDCLLAPDVPQSGFRLGAVGRLVDLLKEQKTTDVVFIGSVRKPSLLALRPDLFTLRQLPGLSLLSRGDDSLLSLIVRRFERELGVHVRGIHELVPGFLAPSGVFSIVQPTIAQQQAIAIGITAARQHGLQDKGQAVIADSAMVIDREGRDGTAALIRRVQNKVDSVLVKLAKPQQDLRIDMPTIGPDTITQAQTAGLTGIAVSAGKTLIVDKAATIAAADAAGLFLIGIDA